MRVIPAGAIEIATVRQEAEGESYRGKVMVGEVIRRRASLRLFSDGTTESACLFPMQFSGWNQNSQLLRRSLLSDDADQAVADCVRAWAESETSNLMPGATHYYSTDIKAPYWAAAMVFVGQEGKHRFYRAKTAAERAA